MIRRLRTASVVCLFGLLSHAKAQVDLGIGIRRGISRFDDPIGSGAQFGGHASLRIAPKVDFEAMAEVFSSSWNENQLEVTWRNALMGITASHSFSLPTRTVRPYLGAGMCLHMLSKEFLSDAVGVSAPQKQSSSEGCLHVLGGLRFHLPALPVAVFVEGRYMAVGDEETPDFPSLLGGVTLNILR